MVFLVLFPYGSDKTWTGMEVQSPSLNQDIGCQHHPSTTWLKEARPNGRTLSICTPNAATVAELTSQHKSQVNAVEPVPNANQLDIQYFSVSTSLHLEDVSRVCYKHLALKPKNKEEHTSKLVLLKKVSLFNSILD